MGLEVVKPGLFSTVQDQGRPGYREFGVALGGSFDRGSAAIANALLGNPAGCAVVELTLSGGQYRARAPLALALAGARMAAHVCGRDGRRTPLRLPLCFPLDQGEELVVGQSTAGARCYLAVSGGWQTPLMLGSRSSETPLAAGAVLPCEPGWTPARHLEASRVPPAADRTTTVRFLDGPDAGRSRDWSGPGVVYEVGRQSNRAGLRLVGPRVEVVHDPDRLSAPVAPGAVQIAGGQPIVLGVACGTMGGYPHVAHVVSADLDLLAQLRPGDGLRFERVSLAEARALDARDRDRRAADCARTATAAGDRPAARGGP